MKGLYRFTFLHLSFFIGALILSNVWVFIALSFLAGLVPRLRINFFYYLLLAILAFVVALFIKSVPQFINQSISNIMELESVSLWVVIAIVSTLTMTILAKAGNALLMIISPAPEKAPEGDEEDEEEYID